MPAAVSVGNPVGRAASSLGRVELGDAEVENLDAPVARDEQVVGFHVAMHDALVVRGGESFRRLTRVVDDFAQGQRAVCQPAAAAIRPRAAPRRCRARRRGLPMS